MAQELLQVKSQLKSCAQIVGLEVDRIDDQVRILDQESQKVEEGFASTVAGRLREKQTKDKPCTRLSDPSCI